MKKNREGTHECRLTAYTSKWHLWLLYLVKTNEMPKHKECDALTPSSRQQDWRCTAGKARSPKWSPAFSFDSALAPPWLRRWKVYVPGEKMNSLGHSLGVWSSVGDSTQKSASMWLLLKVAGSVVCRSYRWWQTVCAAKHLHPQRVRMAEFVVQIGNKTSRHQALFKRLT